MDQRSTDGLRKAARRVFWEANRLENDEKRQTEMKYLYAMSFLLNYASGISKSSELHKTGNLMPDDEVGRWSTEWELMYNAQLSVLKDMIQNLKCAYDNHAGDYALVLDSEFGNLHEAENMTDEMKTFIKITWAEVFNTKAA